jgi:hypothetical protein
MCVHVCGRVRVCSATWGTAAADYGCKLPELKAKLAEAQTPERLDKLVAVADKLEDTKEVVRQTMTALLERGRKLGELADASADLSLAAKAWVRVSIRRPLLQGLCSYPCVPRLDLPYSDSTRQPPVHRILSRSHSPQRLRRSTLPRYTPVTPLPSAQPDAAPHRTCAPLPPPPGQETEKTKPRWCCAVM